MTHKQLTLAIAGGLLAGFGVFVYSEYSRDIRVARARVSSGSRIVDTPCGRIEYADAGSGPTVLVVHGAGGGFDQGLDLAQPLIDAGFRVIAVSRFGYLRTPMPGVASPEAQADAQSGKELQNGCCPRLQDGFHHQLASRIQNRDNRDRNRCLVNIQPDTMWPSRLCREERKPIQQLCLRLEAARFESPHCST